jgi:hypothetical protein
LNHEDTKARGFFFRKKRRKLSCRSLAVLTYDDKKIPHLQFSDDIEDLCDVTIQYYLRFSSHGSEVEQRLEENQTKDERRTNI